MNKQASNEKKEMIEYQVDFVGVTPNQAQAIEGVIMAIQKIKERDELPISKYQAELGVMNVDFILFKDVHTAIKNSRYTDLIERINKRLNYYEQETGSRESLIKKHKENITYIDDYVKDIREHIIEEVDHDNHKATYTYDWSYFKPFLDLANIVFELKFEEPQKE